MTNPPGSSGEQHDPIVCVVVRAWPRVSTTFIAQELVGLEREGLTLWIGSVVPGEKVRHALHDQLRAHVQYLSGSGGIARLLRSWRRVRRKPGYAHARAMLGKDLADGGKPSRLLAFARAMVLVAEMPEQTGIIYAHFLNSGMNVGRYAAAIAGLPIAASAHARDIWTSSKANKKAKLAQMEWCATCTSSGAEHLRSLADPPEKVHLIHHGLSFGRFPEDIPERPSRDGSDPAHPVRLLTVGRAVEKKGFDILLESLALLPRNVHWRLAHIGGGERIDALQRQARTLGIGDQIEWLGTQGQDMVIARYRDSDLFVLPSREGSDGDRDGLPNVLMEAQSQALACISTRFSAIPELIVDGETGLLVPPGEPRSLASAIERLIHASGERDQLGRAGYRRVRAHFQAEAGISEIARLLRSSMAAPARRA